MYTLLEYKLSETEKNLPPKILFRSEKLTEVVKFNLEYCSQHAAYPIQLTEGTTLATLSCYLKDGEVYGLGIGHNIPSKDQQHGNF